MSTATTPTTDPSPRSRRHRRHADAGADAGDGAWTEAEAAMRGRSGAERHGGRRGGGTAARRAIIRWSWRLFRREWRQQVLVLTMISVAVAATIVGAGVATNTPPPANATFRSANHLVTLSGDDPALASQLTAIGRAFGPIDVIENQVIPTGLAGGADLRAQDPTGPFGRPTLRLLSGSLPQAADQVAVTTQLASTYDLHLGSSWTAAGRIWQVVGEIENPRNLLDNFALVQPGQLPAPSQVTVLFDASAAQVSAFAFPAGASPIAPSHNGGLSPAFIVLAVAIVSLIFIGLVASASFAVLAQRRLRSLGMVSSLGATDRNVRLVMVANGAVVGVVATAIGAAVGLAAWAAYVPQLSAGAHHLITWTQLPWWLVVTGMALAVVTSIVASRRPARAIARVPVIAALSGRPAPPKPLHRSALPGFLLLAAGFGLLIASGGDGGGNAGEGLAGLLAMTVGLLFLTPLALTQLALVGKRVPLPARLAVRDLARYRARSGAALAASSFAVFIAVVTALVATGRYRDPVDYFGPNLAANQVVVNDPLVAPVGFKPDRAGGRRSPSDGSGQPPPMVPAASPEGLQQGAQSIARALGATNSVPLEDAQVALNEGRRGNPGTIYVATAAVLAHYGISPNQIAASTDLITSRSGLAWASHLELSSETGGGDLHNPTIQTFHQLPTDTSDPNLLITESGLARLAETVPSSPSAWLIQAPHGITAQQISTARSIAANAKLTIETKSDAPSLDQVRNYATAAGVLLALGVLAMTVGLIRSETAGDLRTLAATGASSRTRRNITSATAAALALMAGILGTAVGYVAMVGFFWHDLAARMSHPPALDLVAILIGLPVAAAAGGWLFAGRQPPALARRPME